MSNRNQSQPYDRDRYGRGNHREYHGSNHDRYRDRNYRINEGEDLDRNYGREYNPDRDTGYGAADYPTGRNFDRNYDREFGGYGREFDRDNERDYDRYGRQFNQNYERDYDRYGGQSNRNYGQDSGRYGGQSNQNYGQESGRYGGQSNQNYGQDYGRYGGQSRNDEGNYGQSLDQDRARGASAGYGQYRTSYREGPHTGKGPKGYKRSSENLKEQVCDHLERNGDLDASEIEVEVKDCEVTLSGKVSCREDKRDAERCAESVDGVKDVHNRLNVDTSMAGRSQSGQDTGSDRGASARTSKSKDNNQTG
jgi:osmotically-inducible protein OsmY